MAKKRQDDRYVAKVMVDGKAKYVYGKTVKERDEKVRELKRKLDKGLDISAEKDTFGYWREKWLKLKQVEVSHGRYRTYFARSAHLEKIFNIEITRVRASDIQDIILELAVLNPNTGKPMAKQSLRELKQISAQIIQLAIDNRVLDYNCAQAVKIPADTEQKTKEALTEEQRQWIIDTPHRAQTAAMIMLFAGLRRGELIPLQWKDIDFDNRCISINKAVEYIEDKPHVKPKGKSDAAMRTVYIPQMLMDYLRPHRGAAFELVCPSAGHTLMTNTAWKRLWESYLNELNFKYGNFESNIAWMAKHKSRPTSKHSPEKPPMMIPRFTAHSLRHTYITMLYMAGVDVLTAKEQAGHADIQTTLGIYTHLNSEYKKQHIVKFDEYLSKNPNFKSCQLGGQIN
jgi:integrase